MGWCKIGSCPWDLQFPKLESIFRKVALGQLLWGRICSSQSWCCSWKTSLSDAVLLAVLSFFHLQKTCFYVLFCSHLPRFTMWASVSFVLLNLTKECCLKKPAGPFNLLVMEPYCIQATCFVNLLCKGFCKSSQIQLGRIVWTILVQPMLQIEPPTMKYSV